MRAELEEEDDDRNAQQREMSRTRDLRSFLEGSTSEMRRDLTETSLDSGGVWVDSEMSFRRDSDNLSSCSWSAKDVFDMLLIMRVTDGTS